MTEHPAQEDSQAIRQLMERAAIYRAISAPTALVGGVLSLGLAALMLLWQAGDAERNVEAPLFYVAWSIVLALTATANTFFIWREAHQRAQSPVSPAVKMALRSIMPALFSGAAISACLAMTSDQAFVPVLFWLVFYGLALLSTMNFSPGSIVALGWVFLMTGLAAFIYFMNVTLLPFTDLPTPTRFYPAAIMGATFGLYHLIYAVCAWPRRRRIGHTGRAPADR